MLLPPLLPHAASQNSTCKHANFNDYNNYGYNASTCIILCWQPWCCLRSEMVIAPGQLQELKIILLALCMHYYIATSRMDKSPVA